MNIAIITSVASTLHNPFLGLSWAQLLLLAVAIAVCSCVWVKLLIRRYQQVGRMDVPNQRSMHHAATPTGAGIVIVTLLVLAAVYLALNLASLQFFVMAMVIALLGVIGWLDDKNHLSVKSRLMVFFALSFVLVLVVGRVDQIAFGQLGVWLLPLPVAMLLTVFGFIWLLNLYNFMDGMDGLAAMQTIIAASGFLVLFADIAFLQGRFFDAQTVSSGLVLLCAVLVCASVGFLVWNWSPAKIFLGDVGSLPIGGFFALCSIVAVAELDVSILSCVLILGVFIFDASYTLLARLSRGERITEAHRSHIYQRLAGVGVAHRVIVSVYAVLMVLFAGLAILWEWQIISGLLTGVMALIGVLFMQLWVRFLERKRES